MLASCSKLCVFPLLHVITQCLRLSTHQEGAQTNSYSICFFGEHDCGKKPLCIEQIVLVLDTDMQVLLYHPVATHLLLHHAIDSLSPLQMSVLLQACALWPLQVAVQVSKHVA